MINQPAPYILIVGHGRSGTNWLLRMLDASPETHCRNEPNEIKDSALEFVQELWFSDTIIDEVTSRWERQAAIAKISMSERDHHIVNRKNHIHNLASQTKLTALLSRAQARKALSFLVPSFRQGEWIMPGWISDLHALKQSCTVLKINMLAACFVNWYISQYPAYPVIHIVRHPGGYLNSSIKRFFSKRTPQELAQEETLYKTMLRTATHNFPFWGDIIGDIESMNFMEAIIWFWRLNNEVIYLHGKSHSNYKLLVYEDIVTNPLEQSQAIYEFCGLSWNQKTECTITNGLNASVWGKLPETQAQVADAWKTQLDDEWKQLIDDIVMTKSAMTSWWHS